MLSPPDPIQTLLDAVAHHQAGRLTEAEVGYAAVLSAMPEQPQALFFAGMLEVRVGRAETAVVLLQRSIAVRPEHAESRFALGNAYWNLDQKRAAMSAWDETLHLDRQHIGALLNSGRACEEAGDFIGAMGFCHRAVLVAPQQAAAHAALSAAMRAAGQADAALTAAQTAVALAPDSPQAQFQLGTSLKHLGRYEDAVTALREAVRLQPDYAGALLNLANTVHELGDLAEAEHLCRIAIATDPDMAEAHAVLGFLLTETGALDEAIEACEEATRLHPDLAEAHWNLGIALLLAGDLGRGFAKYEWRKRHPRYARQFVRLPGREWAGEPLAGKRLLILGEQGLGDTIMFARYAQTLAAQGAEIVLACDRRLIAFLKRAPGMADVIDKQDTLPAYDFWVDQMSLPLLCGTSLNTIPASDRYLRADPDRVAVWGERLGPRTAGRQRIGIVWAGNPLHFNDRNRSACAEVFGALAEHPGLELVSLQVGPSASDAAALGLRDWSPLLCDYAETAGLVANLDLVITIDSSVAHLSGALGRPTWLLLPAAPDWRWLRDRTHTPWYGSMRLFRQRRPGDWGTVLQRVAEALAG